MKLTTVLSAAGVLAVTAVLTLATPAQAGHDGWRGSPHGGAGQAWGGHEGGGHEWGGHDRGGWGGHDRGEWRGHERGEWRGREWGERERHWRPEYRPYAYGPPPVFFAPPVFYPPPYGGGW